MIIRHSVDPFGKIAIAVELDDDDILAVNEFSLNMNDNLLKTGKLYSEKIEEHRGRVRGSTIQKGDK